jgi:hypothetical protein
MILQASLDPAGLWRKVGEIGCALAKSQLFSLEFLLLPMQVDTVGLGAE